MNVEGAINELPKDGRGLLIISPRPLSDAELKDRIFQGVLASMDQEKRDAVVKMAEGMFRTLSDDCDTLDAFVASSMIQDILFGTMHRTEQTTEAPA